jgi:uncharacterized membrane protein YfcA
LTLHDSIFLFGAALAAGALNSVAGGGGFIAFPALIFTGVPPIQANATNTVALWPGTVASTGAYRRAISPEARRMLGPMILSGIAGGIIGAWLLLHTPQKTFLGMVPWMLLSATVLFLFSRPLVRWFHERTSGWKHNGRVAKFAPALLQLPIAIYIGYFGAGAGMMVMAMLALMGIKNIHTLNGVKTLLVSVCNGVAIITFVIAHAVMWPQALLMVVAAAIGGYGGAHYAQKMPESSVRAIATATGLAMSIYFFLRR